jgi:hypothetical protein
VGRRLAAACGRKAGGGSQEKGGGVRVGLPAAQSEAREDALWGEFRERGRSRGAIGRLMISVSLF